MQSQRTGSCPGRGLLLWLCASQLFRLLPFVLLQWVYYAYLAAVKEQDGAAMSMGRIDAFLDTYFENDLKAGRITEEEVQELIDQFVMKMRIVR